MVLLAVLSFFLLLRFCKPTWLLTAKSKRMNAVKALKGSDSLLIGQALKSQFLHENQLIGRLYLNIDP